MSIESPERADWPPVASVLTRFSIGQKMLLVTLALLVTVTGALISAAFVEARHSAELVASARLREISRQLGGMLRTSSLQLGTQSAATARKPEISAYLQAPTRASRNAALEALRYTGPQTNQILRIELRDSRDSVLLSTTDGAAEGGSTTDFGPPGTAAPGDSVTVGKLRPVNDSVVYPVSARVPRSGASVIHWRRLATSRRAREQITQLVGSNATILIGDADGSFWTDLEGTVNVPSGAASAVEGDTSGDAFRSGDILVSSVLIGDTPWAVRVHTPRGSLMAPVFAFTGRLTLLATAFLAAGLVLAWLLSRRLTLPLRRLTSAADILAAGQRPPVIPAEGSDEIGRLGRSFNIMAHQIEESRSLLEHRVDERTRELNSALTALRNAQDSLVRKEKLAMLGQLASSVGHELRNPLGVMTNAVYYLEAVQRDASDTVKEYLGILRQQVHLSERIVSDLLDFARTKSPQRERVSVSTILQTQLDRVPGLNGIPVEQNIPADLPDVHVDPMQIGQVVLNLLTNAVQAVGEGGGSIGITARVDGDNRVLLEVTDSGPGVPAENLEKIFEPLFTTRARGIGLGLAVSRGLARANDCELELGRSSGPTTFVLTLPLQAQEPA